MKKAGAAIAIALMVLPTVAMADGWRGGYGYRHHGGHRSSIHLSSGGEVAVGILLGGLAVALLTQPYRYSGYGYRGDYRYSSYGHRRPYRTYYAPPPPPRRYVHHRNCSPIQGNGTYHGRPARFGGTHCYDGYGNGYIVPGSAQFLYYLR